MAKTKAVKSRRRAANEGCVTKRKNGKWMTMYPIGKDTKGKLKYKYAYRDTQKEALEALREFQIKYPIGTQHKEVDYTLAEWLEFWLYQYKSNLANSTFTSYETNIRCHVNDQIGGVLLTNLELGHLQQLLDNVYQGGKRSLSLFVKVYNILNGALDKAHELRYIERNPIKGVVFPKEKPKKIVAFSQEEQQRIEKALEGHKSRALFLTYLYTGARLAEGAAIFWNDIDFENKTIHITKQIKLAKKRSKDKSDGKIYTLEVVEELKTSSSCRYIYITDKLVEILKAHKAEQMELAKKMKIAWREDWLVFPAVRGRKDFGIPHPRNIEEKYISILKKANVQKQEGSAVHTLRHTYATRLFELDIPVKLISQQLGHKSIKTTLDIYVDVLPQKALMEMSKLNALDMLGSTDSAIA